MFFDKFSILEHFFNPEEEGDSLNIVMAFRGEHPEYLYEYSGEKENVTLKLSNMGAVVCILNKSYSCWNYILNLKKGFFSMEETLELAKMICYENWD